MAIYWNKELNVTPIHGMESERLTGIIVKNHSNFQTVVLYVYMPNDDCHEKYTATLLELENIIDKYVYNSSIIILGDFSAQMFSLNSNQLGKSVLLWDFMSRNNLSCTAKHALHYGPEYTCLNTMTV